MNIEEEVSQTMVSFRLSHALLEHLTETAERTGISRSEALRESVRSWVAKKDRENIEWKEQG